MTPVALGTLNLQESTVNNIFLDGLYSDIIKKKNAFLLTTPLCEGRLAVLVGTDSVQNRSGAIISSVSEELLPTKPDPPMPSTGDSKVTTTCP